MLKGQPPAYQAVSVEMSQKSLTGMLRNRVAATLGLSVNSPTVAYFNKTGGGVMEACHGESA